MLARVSAVARAARPLPILQASTRPARCMSIAPRTGSRCAVPGSNAQILSGLLATLPDHKQLFDQVLLIGPGIFYFDNIPYCAMVQEFRLLTQAAEVEVNSCTVLDISAEVITAAKPSPRLILPNSLELCNLIAQTLLDGIQRELEHKHYQETDQLEADGITWNIYSGAPLQLPNESYREGCISELSLASDSHTLIYAVDVLESPYRDIHCFQKPKTPPPHYIDTKHTYIKKILNALKKDGILVIDNFTLALFLIPLKKLQEFIPSKTNATSLDNQAFEVDQVLFHDLQTALAVVDDFSGLLETSEFIIGSKAFGYQKLNRHMGAVKRVR